MRCYHEHFRSPILSWSVQQPNQGLQIHLRHTSVKSIKGFIGDLNKGKISFLLKKALDHKENSATYFSAVIDAGVAEHELLRSCRKLFSVTPLYGHKGAMLLQRRLMYIPHTHVHTVARNCFKKSGNYYLLINYCLCFNLYLLIISVSIYVSIHTKLYLCLF